MTVIPRSKFLNIAMMCSASLGIFPSQFLFQENRLGQICYSTYSKLCFGYFSTIVLTCYIEFFVIIFRDQINFAELSKNLILTPLFTITIVRQIFIMTPRFQSLLKHIINNEKYMDGIDDKEVTEIDKKSANGLNRNIKFYLGMMVVTEILYTLRPHFESKDEIVIGNKTVFVKQLPLSTWFPFDRQQHFMTAYLIHVVDIVFGSCYETYGEFILIAAILYPTSRLKVLRYVLVNFETYQQKLIKRYGIQNDLAAFITLRECIHWHKSIIKYVDQFNEVMASCMFLDFIQSSLHMACVLAETLTQGITLVQLISVGAYLIILNFRLFLYYYYANEVILLSQSLSLDIYQSKWYQQTRRVKFMTFMIIMRNQKPLKFKLGAFGNMSISKFLSILNAAYSYVMLMCSVK